MLPGNQQKLLLQKLLSQLTVSLLFIFVIAAGCDSTTQYEDNGNGEPGENEVWMVGQSFTPGTIEIETGTTITWTNQSSEVHTVTSGSPGSPDGEFDSGNMSAGQEFSHTFEEAGSFDYYCALHPGMTGTITVNE